MPQIHQRACLIFTLLFSGCSPQDATPQGVDSAADQAPVAPAPPKENIGDIMKRYKDAPECEGKDYADFISMENRISEGVPDTPPELIWVVEKLRESAAHSMIEVAEYATEKHCPQTARKTYLAVIDTFTGSDYAAVRQRAQIGIDDLRAAQMQVKGAQP